VFRLGHSVVVAIVGLNGKHGIRTLDWKQSCYELTDLLRCGRGELFGSGNARLPLPPMLMFDRISKITDKGGSHSRGEAIAEFGLRPDQWFFDCHFKSDPVMPGCLGLDALWQLLGFYLGWLGLPGRGRALGVGKVKFSGEILPAEAVVTYRIDIRRVIKRKLILGIADGAVFLNGEKIYDAENLRVGLFATADRVGAGV
jgi:3-hydroxyacyl-[acyl-carrier protein] dehydratase/trans-2-decenoyl-[acyl-carrier protein] isomerase